MDYTDSIEEEMDTDLESAEDAEEDQVTAHLPIFRSSSLGCMCTSPERDVQTSGFPLREAQSFPSAFEQLRVCTQNETHVKLRLSAKRENGAYNGKCPCGCLSSKPGEVSFRTRELPSMALFIAGPEILNFQGTKYFPRDIAAVWKKDCRTWLWKNRKPFGGGLRDAMISRQQQDTNSLQQGDESACNKVVKK